MKCKIGNIQVSYEIVGEGRPILMLHGWPVDHSYMMAAFEPVFEALDGWQRVYFDLPGMGNTPGAEWIKTNDDMLQVVLDFIDQIVPEHNFTLIGLSYGAYLAKGLIHKRSTSIDGLMMHVPAIFIDRTKRTIPKHIILFENPNYYEELKANNLEDLIVYTTDQNAECLKNLRTVAMPSIAKADFNFLGAIEHDKEFSFLSDDEVPSFSKPTLIVAGRQDSVVGYQDVWQMIDEYPRATFAVLDYAGHALGVGERNTVFRALVVDWIDRLEREKPCCIQ